MIYVQPRKSIRGCIRWLIGQSAGWLIRRLVVYIYKNLKVRGFFMKQAHPGNSMRHLRDSSAGVTDTRTDGRTDRRTDRRKDPLIEMQ